MADSQKIKISGATADEETKAAGVSKTSTDFAGLWKSNVISVKALKFVVALVLWTCTSCSRIMLTDVKNSVTSGFDGAKGLKERSDGTWLPEMTDRAYVKACVKLEISLSIPTFGSLSLSMNFVG